MGENDRVFYFTESALAEYCVLSVGAFDGMSLREDISGTTCPNFTIVSCLLPMVMALSSSGSVAISCVHCVSEKNKTPNSCT